jgi:hypothetical protein
VYFVAFITNLTWTPSILLPARRTLGPNHSLNVAKFLKLSLMFILLNEGALARTASYFLLVLSGLALIGHIIFHSVLLASGNYGREFLPDGSITTDIIAFIGFQRCGGTHPSCRFLVSREILTCFIIHIGSYLLEMASDFSHRTSWCFWCLYSS